MTQHHRNIGDHANEMKLLEEWELARADFLRALNQLLTRARVAMRRRLIEKLGENRTDAGVAKARAQAHEIVKAYMRGDELPAAQKALVKTVPQMDALREMYRIGTVAKTEVEQKMTQAARNVLDNQRHVRKLVRNLPRQVA